MNVVAQRVVRSGGRVSLRARRERGGGRSRRVPAVSGWRPASTSSPRPERRDRSSAGTGADERPLDHYYPHASTPEEAQVIRVAAGGEMPGIDLIATLPSSPGPQFPRSTAGPVCRTSAPSAAASSTPMACRCVCGACAMKSATAPTGRISRRHQTTTAGTRSATCRPVRYRLQRARISARAPIASASGGRPIAAPRSR